MSELRAKIVQDTKVSVFHLTQDRISYPKDKGSPLLQRLAPKRPPLNSAPPEQMLQESKHSSKDE